MDYTLSLLTFFLGLGLGHWLAIGRDKRKEFNDKAVELNSKIYDYIEQENNYFLPSMKELTLFTSYIPLYRRWLYKKLLKRLDDSLSLDGKSCVYSPSYGIQTVIPDYESKTKVLVNKLIWHLERI